MPRDEKPYTGPLVIIRQVSDHSYEVGIDPPLPGADCNPRQFGSKCEAYAAAQGLWTKHRLGCRDELVGNIGRQSADYSNDASTFSVRIGERLEPYRSSTDGGHKVFKPKRLAYLTNRKVSQQVHLTEPQIKDLRCRRDANVERIVPPMNHRVGFVEWPPLNAGMFFFMADLMGQGYKAPLAAKLAVRVMDAHLASPTVEQWAIVATENGNVSTLAFDSIELASGLISGSRLSFALVVDLRVYSERVERALAGAGALSDA